MITTLAALVALSRVGEPQHNQHHKTRTGRRLPPWDYGLHLNNDTFIPVHDLWTNPPQSGVITGYFYLGGDWAADSEYYQGVPPRFYLDAHNTFDPAHKWQYVEPQYVKLLTPPGPDPITPPPGKFGEGSYVTFKLTIPPGFPPSLQRGGMIAVVLKGLNKEVPSAPFEQKSFAADEFPTDVTRLSPSRVRQSRRKLTNNVLPIGFHRPISSFLEDEYTRPVWSNNNYSWSPDLYFLDDDYAGVDPVLGQKWKDMNRYANGRFTNNPGNRDEFKFDKKSSENKTVRHYMAVTHGVSHAPKPPGFSRLRAPRDEDYVTVYQWSGVIRTLPLSN